MTRDYPDRPIAAVGVVVVRGDKILLIRRTKPPKANGWSIPGGMQELGETTEQAAVRELFEETSITMEKPQFIDIVNYIDRDRDERIKHHYILIDYAANYRSGSLRAGDDAGEARWVPMDQLSQYDLWPETEKIIYKAINRLKATVNGEAGRGE